MKSQERIFSHQNFNGQYLENKNDDLYIFFALWIPLLIPYQYKLVFWKANDFETEKRTPLIYHSHDSTTHHSSNFIVL